jgi:uncharacterized membrane protein YdbT with pleckstrin-like domain
MSSVAGNLLSNESVVLETRKHWISPVRDSWIAALMILGGLFLWYWNPNGDGPLGFLWTLIALLRWALLLGGIAWIAWNIVAWRTAEFAVTDLRVLRYEGLVQKRSSETLLSAVTDVKLNVGFTGERLGYGDLKIYTQSGEAGADDFTSIVQPAAFRNKMMEIKVQEEAKRRMPAPAPAAAPAPAPAAPAPAAPEQPAPAPTAGANAGDQAARLVALAELRDQGVISAEEFEAKKAEILRRI